MADGTYERRGPREAELKRLQRIIAEQAKKREESAPPAGTGRVSSPSSPREA